MNGMDFDIDKMESMQEEETVCIYGKNMCSRHPS